jgi:hypothetical protein
VSVVPWGVLDCCRAWVGGCVCGYISGSHCCIRCCVLYFPRVDILHCVVGMYLIYCIRI